MKKYYSIAAAGMLLFGMTLASCSNEDFNVETGNYVSVPVSTYITVPTVEETRTTLEEVSGNLEWKWEKGDQVVAIDNDGNNIGYLTAGEPEGNGMRAPFTGTLDFKEGAETEKLTLFYLGKGVSTSSLKSKDKLVIDLQSQDGLYSSLVKRDVLSTPLNGAGKLNVVINPNYTVIPDFDLYHLTAAGHFQLQLKDGTTLNNVDVTISKGESGNFTAKKTINLVGLGSSQNADDRIATRTGNNGDFYLTLLPYSPASMKFVTTYNGKEYTGYLGNDANFSFGITAGQYLRSNSNNFGPLVIVMETNEPEVDDRIFGMHWTESNVSSWMDHDYNYNNVYIHSYIPGIPLKDQGIQMFYTNKSTINVSDNPYVFFFQWDRDFGFIGADKNYDAGTTYVPNAYGDWYYEVRTSALSSIGAGFENFDQLVYLGSGQAMDWCTEKGRMTWAKRQDTFGITAQPEGFRIPTGAEYEKLVPEQSGKTYTYSHSFTWEDQTYYPFYARTENGATYVWYYMKSGSSNYLTIHKFKGSYTTSTVNEDAINKDCVAFVDLKLGGSTVGGKNMNLGSYGFYWAGDSKREGYANCFGIVLNTSSKTMELQYKELPRTYGLTVRCVYDD